MKGIIRGRYYPLLLPDPHSVLKRLNIFYGQTDDLGYWKLRCPFHTKNLHTLKLHHIDGHYFCNICGAEGKNILGYYMESTGKSFLEASTDTALGGFFMLDDNQNKDQETLIYLSTLNPLEYDRVRTAHATSLKVRPSTLDD